MNWGLPPDWSTSGHEIDQLIRMEHWLMLGLGLFWLTHFGVSLWRYRAGSAVQERRPRSSARWPLWMALFLFLFEAGLMVFLEAPLWSQRRVVPPLEDVFQVRVIGEQFAWNFHYPGEDGVFGVTDPLLIDSFNPVGLDMEDPAAADDLVTINQLHVPIGQKILLWLGAKDVIHSFYLPYFRVKQDVLPGRSIPVWFTPTREGASDIGCAQLCGLGHYRMRGRIQVEDAEAFRTWYEEELAYM